MKNPPHYVGPLPFREPMFFIQPPLVINRITMTPENFIIGKAVEAIKELYGTEVGESQLQVNVTRKEFEGD